MGTGPVGGALGSSGAQWGSAVSEIEEARIMSLADHDAAAEVTA